MRSGAIENHLDVMEWLGLGGYAWTGLAGYHLDFHTKMGEWSFMFAMSLGLPLRCLGS